MKTTRTLAVLACMGLAACNRASTPSTPSAPSAKPAQAAEAQPEWDVSEAPVTGAVLEVTPNPGDYCTDKKQAVSVHWDMTAPNPSGLQLWLEDPSGARKLWAAPSVRSGTAETGKWLSPGAKVIAVDASRNRVLVSVTIAAKPCP